MLKYLVALVLVIGILVGGFFLFNSYIYNEKQGEPPVVPPDGPIVAQGEMLCLPHKDATGPQTMECAFGLLDDDGRYFALSDTDPQYGNVTGVPMNERVAVEGTFKSRTDSKYQDIGVISVTKLTRLSSESGNGTMEL